MNHSVEVVDEHSKEPKVYIRNSFIKEMFLGFNNESGKIYFGEVL